MEFFSESSFRMVVADLKAYAGKEGVLIGDQQIMDTLNLQAQDFNAYMAEKVQAPDQLIFLLRDRFAEYIGDLRFEQFSHVVRLFPIDPPTPPFPKEKQ